MTLGRPCETLSLPFEGNNPVLEVGARVSSRAARTAGKDNPGCRACNLAQLPSCNTSSPRCQCGSSQHGRPECAIPVGTV